MTSILITTGRLVDPFNIQNYTFTAKDFIRPLCLLNRYTGHTVRPIPVAEHSYKLSIAPEVVAAELERAALLHDFNEALTNDLPYPFKAALPDYQSFEEQVQRHIFKVFNEPWENMEKLKPFDRRICQDEMMALFSEPFDLGLEPLGVEYTTDEQHWSVWEELLTNRCLQFGIY